MTTKTYSADAVNKVELAIRRVKAELRANPVGYNIDIDELLERFADELAALTKDTTP